MWPEPASVLPLLAVSPLLLIMMGTDLRQMRIPNWLVLGMLAVFAVTAPFSLHWAEIGLRVVVALCVFIVFIGLYALNLFGGGDVKALAALLLFVPFSALSLFAYVFSAAMLVGIGGIVLLRRAVGSPESRWVALARPGEFPMGVSIGMAGLALLALWAVTYT